MSKGRKRNGLKAMADFAFKRCHELRTENAQKAAQGFNGYPRPTIEAEANMLEDVCDFIDAVRGLNEKSKKEIVDQIAKGAPRKAPEIDPPHSKTGQNQNG
jgi:hypothetical protein